MLNLRFIPAIYTEIQSTENTKIIGYDITPEQPNTHKTIFVTKTTNLMYGNLLSSGNVACVPFDSN